MNIRAMDAVFPIREKSVNRIESFSESSSKDADGYWSSESSLNGPEMNSTDLQS